MPSTFDARILGRKPGWIVEGAERGGDDGGLARRRPGAEAVLQFGGGRKYPAVRSPLGLRRAGRRGG